MHLPPDCRGCSRKFWLAEPGTQHQPDLHRTAGETTKVWDLWGSSISQTLKIKHRAKMYFVELCYQIWHLIDTLYIIQDMGNAILIYGLLNSFIHSIPFHASSSTVEHLRLFFPKRRSHHTRVRKRGRSSAETGSRERRDPEPALPPCPPFRLPVVVPVCQVGRVVRWPAACCA